jgi:hypothetical protein
MGVEADAGHHDEMARAGRTVGAAEADRHGAAFQQGRRDPVQGDGDIIARLPATFTLESAALEFLMPAK